MSITKNDFMDDLSKDIFYYRERFYRSRDFNNILEMLCKEYDAYVKKVNDIYDNLTSKLRESTGDFVIFGAGKNGKKAKIFLENEGLGYRLKCFAVSKDVYEQENVRGIKDLWKDKSLLYLIPDGKYAYEMYACLRGGDIPSDRIIFLPSVIIDGNRINIRNDILEIFMDEKNHFVVYGADWRAYLIRHLLHHSGKNAGFVIAEQDRIPNDMSLFKDMDNCYLIVYSQERRKFLLSQGIAEEKIIHLVNVDEFQYFDDEILPEKLKYEQGYFIDGGSANLYTSESYLRWCEDRCNGIIAFECDERCTSIIKDKIARDKKFGEICQLFEYGLWSSETELKFAIDNNLGSSSVYYPVQSNGKEIKIRTTTIDDCVENRKITFIKLDIEGAELEALKGAEKTIKKYKPTLAIAVYHKPQDIVEIPEFIKSIVPGYKFYIRNYHFDMTEAVLYAIYEE